METASIFTMDHVNTVIKMEFTEAKRYALEIVMQDGGARDKTKAKAKQMIAKTKNTNNLAYAMSCWILAHPSEGLKVVSVMA